MKSIRNRLFETIDLEIRVVPATCLSGAVLAVPVPPDESAFRFPSESVLKAEFPAAFPAPFASELDVYFPLAISRPIAVVEGPETPSANPDFGFGPSPAASTLHAAAGLPINEALLTRIAGDFGVHLLFEIAPVPDGDGSHSATPPNRAAPRSIAAEGAHLPEAAAANPASARVGVYTSAVIAAEDNPAVAIESAPSIADLPAVPPKKPSTAAAAQSPPEVAWSLVPSAGDVAADIAAVEAGARDLLRHLARTTAAVGWESDGDQLVVFSAAFVGAAGLGYSLRTAPPARRFRRSPFSPEPSPHDPSPAR